MRLYVIKSINSKHVLTIIFKCEASDKEWKDVYFRPFMSLEQDTIYSLDYVLLKKFVTFKYIFRGTPDILYKWLLERLNDSCQSMITIKDKDNKKERWVFVIR